MKKINRQRSKIVKLSLGLGSLATIGIVGPAVVACGESDFESESKKVKKQLENLVASNFNFANGTWNLNADVNSLLQSVDVSAQYSIDGGILWSKTNPIVNSQYTPVLAKLVNNDPDYNPVAVFDTPDAWLTLNLPQVNLEDKLAQKNFFFQGLEKEGNIGSVFSSGDWTYMIQVNDSPAVKLNEVNNLKTGDKLTISIVINESINKENAEKFAVPEPVTFSVEEGHLLKKNIQDKLNFNNFLIQGKENQGTISSISSSENWTYMIQVNASPAVKLSEVNNLKTGDELTVFIQASDEFWKEYSIPDPVTFSLEAGVLMPEDAPHNPIEINENNYLYESNFQFNNGVGQGKISAVKSENYFDYLVSVNGQAPQIISHISHIKTGDTLKITILPKYKNVTLSGAKSDLTFQVDSQMILYSWSYLSPEFFQFNGLNGQGTMSVDINYAKYVKYVVSINGETPVYIEEVNNLKNGDQLQIYLEAVAPYSLNDSESYQRIEVQGLSGEPTDAKDVLDASNFYIRYDRTIGEDSYGYNNKLFTFMAIVNGETKPIWDTVVEGGDRIKIFISENLAADGGITFYNEDAFVEFTLFVHPISGEWSLLKMDTDK